MLKRFNKLNKLLNGFSDGGEIPETNLVDPSRDQQLYSPERQGTISAPPEDEFRQRLLGKILGHEPSSEEMLSDKQREDAAVSAGSMSGGIKNVGSKFPIGGIFSHGREAGSKITSSSPNEIGMKLPSGTEMSTHPSNLDPKSLSMKDTNKFEQLIGNYVPEGNFAGSKIKKIRFNPETSKYEATLAIPGSKGEFVTDLKDITKMPMINNMLTGVKRIRE